ncbi:sulfite exporter TauE/SafE family protein [Pontibacter sp. SGAir0037]|uniref:sulfite exporter TauE/SafE family protein n=1 Tax=Pontibacter sp. SGAir0037 TaxID=2571030 RepID=UPI0010CD2C1A|nr:sulfite exporter TauE/SafE family protein [Pontibacter sp. SGAir0037]QCR21529.1 hypothetical protein C1N53_03650 [Pontibacter sp. SGAir0037]
MEILGYLAALAIGLSLGLIGGGGSILTVPVLVYILGYSPVLSTAYSLFIVGLTSLAGSYQFYKKGLVSLKTALVFGLPSIVAVYMTRRYLVPAIPAEILETGEFILTKDMLLMLLFAALMVFASVSMIRAGSAKKEEAAPKGASEHQAPENFNYAGILAEGLVVGTVTGLVGAGGGFLIIPALVIFSKLDMKMAVGTSLLIIAAKSLFGFVGDIFNYSIDWLFLLIFSAVSIAGIYIGSALSGKIQAAKLKSGFGWFVLLMGVYIILKEVYLT